MSGLEQSDVVILNTEYKSHTRVKHNKRKEVQKCQNAVIERVLTFLYLLSFVMLNSCVTLVFCVQDYYVTLF